MTIKKRKQAKPQRASGAVLDGPMTQLAFAELLGVSQQAVSRLAVDGVLSPSATGMTWLLAYFDRLRAQAAGRLSGTSKGAASLTLERAALVRSQREANEYKLAVLQGKYAPIERLADVLADAAQAVNEQFDQLPANLKVACPDLPAESRDAVVKAIAAARNNWRTKTESLLADALDPGDQPIEQAGAPT